MLLDSDGDQSCSGVSDGDPDVSGTLMWTLMLGGC